MTRTKCFDKADPAWRVPSETETRNKIIIHPEIWGPRRRGRAGCCDWLAVPKPQAGLPQMDSTHDAVRFNVGKAPQGRRIGPCRHAAFDRLVRPGRSCWIQNVCATGNAVVGLSFVACCAACALLTSRLGPFQGKGERGNGIRRRCGEEPLSAARCLGLENSNWPISCAVTATRAMPSRASFALPVEISLRKCLVAAGSLESWGWATLCVDGAEPRLRLFMIRS